MLRRLVASTAVLSLTALASEHAWNHDIAAGQEKEEVQNRHHSARTASDEKTEPASATLETKQTREKHTEPSSKTAEVHHHVPEDDIPLDDDDAFIDLTVQEAPRARHRPREITDSSATQVRLQQGDGTVEELDSLHTEKAGAAVGARVNRVLVDAFSGAGVHSIHADPSLNRELATRLSTQDVAVGIMLLVFYFLTVTFGWVVVYRMASNSSPTKFFCDPDEHPHAVGPAPGILTGTHASGSGGAGPLLTKNNNIDDFMKTFCRQPPSIQLNIAGFREESLDSPLGLSGSLSKWGGKFWSTRFNIALLISDFAPDLGTLSTKDRAELEEFLSSDNGLARLAVNKHVSWNAFGEISERIKRTIRDKGFVGPIDIRLDGHEELNIYQNNTWSNFWHNRTTKILVVLSVVGPLIYYPLMWLRGKKKTVTADFKLQVSADQYWSIIESRLSTQGFACSRDLQQVIAEHGN